MYKYIEALNAKQIGTMFERLQASKGIRQSQLLQYYTTKCMKKMWNNFQMAGKLIRQASKGEKFAGQRGNVVNYGEARSEGRNLKNS